MIKVGLIGYGYWGPNLARNLMRTATIDLTRIVDMNPRRLEAVQRDWPGVAVSDRPEDLTRASDIDAVVIATPIRTHFELAMDALKNGKHVLVEKPMTDSVRDSEALIEEAARQKVVLMVDHTFVYTGAVRWMRDFMASGEIGDLYYFDSIRTNLGLFQSDSSVIWDLAPHDLSILEAILKRPVKSVSATGSCHAGSKVPNIAYLSLDLDNGAIAHFHVNWLSPVKVRQILLAGTQKMVIFDDMQNSEKIKVYDSGVTIQHDDTTGQHKMQVDYRTGDMRSPAIPAREALQVEMEHFADCIQNGKTPETDGIAGLRVVQILEAAEASIQRGGARINL